jgi:hypothetical protein
VKQIQPTPNEHQWPRNAVKSIECRKKDLVVRISNWLRDKDEPGYDVECYIGGTYDWNESECFTIHKYATKNAAKKAAVAYAQNQIAKLL